MIIIQEHRSLWQCCRDELNDNLTDPKSEIIRTGNTLANGNRKDIEIMIPNT